MLALLLNPGLSLSQPRKAMSKIHNFGMLVKIFKIVVPFGRMGFSHAETLQMELQILEVSCSFKKINPMNVDNSTSKGSCLKI